MKMKKKLNFSSMRKNFSNLLTGVEDRRQQGKVDHSVHDAVMSGFACMYFQDPSLKAFQERLADSRQKSNLHTLFGVRSIPGDTQLRSVLDDFDSEAFRPVFNASFANVQRAKLLAKYEVFPNCYYAAMDATQYFSSNSIHCDNCLVKNHRNGTVSFSHSMLMAAIMHPDMPQVIPLMPEQICNADGGTKQDCEVNAAKRLLPKMKKDHPRLELIIGGDSLYSRQPMILCVREQGGHYIFVAKPTDHPVMMRHIEGLAMETKRSVGEDGAIHLYEWINNVPLNGNADAVRVNFFRYTKTTVDKASAEHIAYRNSWVTDMKVDADNAETLVRVGRCRWKVENECFQTLKNQGYHIEHNYGHGENNLCFNFLLLILIAFMFHQILELADKLYQACRKKFGSKWHMWETLRSYIKILIFDSWEHLLDFALDPIKYNPAISQAP